MRRIVLAAIISSLPAAAAAHPGADAVWALDPWIALPMALAGALYCLGMWTLWELWIPGRPTSLGRGIGIGRVACYLAGFATLGLALFSPLEHHAERLFSAHMVQHQLLMLVAAPLVVLGRPGVAMFIALPRQAAAAFVRGIRRAALLPACRGLAHPVTAWVVFLAVLWLWHVPPFYQAAVADLWVHRLQHVSFFLAAVLWWSSVLGRLAQAEGFGLALLSVFTTAVHACALGALLTVSTRLWYPIYADRAATYGLSPLEDQQLGGLVMWVPSGVVFLLAALFITAGGLAAAEARVAAAERRRPLLKTEHAR